jgi:hypothetical protein
MSEVLAALGGAAVGFAGAGLLQAARFRREDRSTAKESLGIATLLRAELHLAQSQLSPHLESGNLPRFTRFSVAGWETLAYRIASALDVDDMAALTRAFSGIQVTNAFVAGHQLEMIPLREGDEVFEALNTLSENVRTATSVLDRLIDEYRGR